MFLLSLLVSDAGSKLVLVCSDVVLEGDVTVEDNSPSALDDGLAVDVSIKDVLAVKASVDDEAELDVSLSKLADKEKIEVLAVSVFAEVSVLLKDSVPELKLGDGADSEDKGDEMTDGFELDSRFSVLVLVLALGIEFVEIVSMVSDMDIVDAIPVLLDRGIIVGISLLPDDKVIELDGEDAVDVPALFWEASLSWLEVKVIAVLERPTTVDESDKVADCGPVTSEEEVEDASPGCELVVAVNCSDEEPEDNVAESAPTGGELVTGVSPGDDDEDSEEEVAEPGEF
ncbi:hypothetical protein PFICI_08959 [Pestalotiopsis fici W106-1]|uniref:Uncharacterized protein n=1 Tax=Pestalotiopsis fici (strain W106-1 / CGMCC3.15140) TaxID=1229662 RepID=W3X1R3_PESFW|nr:uncharacterized protein PFICI_08959 [Pestalotiopsis fici W106-1]ETS79106.1 hypothetical protein PFICI_08959 [Pestalotiopsis fici W106-1]